MKCNNFYANTSCHAVTLSFDSSTLKVCGRSVVTCMLIVCSKCDRNRTISGRVIHDLANFCPQDVTVTLNFDLLTLNMCGRSDAMWSIYVPNVSGIGQATAQLLMIFRKFFVRFRGDQYRHGCFKNAWTESAPNLVGTLSDHHYTQSSQTVKISCSISKPQQLNSTVVER